MLRNLIIFLLLSSSLMALKPADIEKKFESRIRKYTLKNGLRVILMKNGFTPTLACYLKVGVGSANEPFDQSGLAHFLEAVLPVAQPAPGQKRQKESDSTNRTNHLLQQTPKSRAGCKPLIPYR